MLVLKPSLTAAAARASTFAFVFVGLFVCFFKPEIMEESRENQTTVCVSHIPAFKGGTSHPSENSAVGILS